MDVEISIDSKLIREVAEALKNMGEEVNPVSIARYIEEATLYRLTIESKSIQPIRENP